MKSKIRQEIQRLEKQTSKLPPLTKEQDVLLDIIAALLADDFFDKFNTGKLRKPE